MEHDPESMTEPGTTPAVPGSAARIPAKVADAGAVIGYEAADPSLCTPYWDEVLRVTGEKKDLR